MKKITLLFLVSFFSLAANAQFTEGFDSATTFPLGWTVIDGGDVDNTWVIVDFTDGDIPAHSGTNAAAIGYDSDAHDDYLITPAITVAAGVNDYFAFWARSRDPEYPEQIALKLSTTGTAPADFTITLDPAVAPSSGADFYKYAYDLSDYVGDTVYIAFYSTTTDMFYFDLDDVESGPLPACLAPNGFSAGDITTAGAVLSWNSSAENFEIEYGLAGFTQGSGTTETVASENSLTLGDLEDGTEYDAYIRTDCGGGEYSEWIQISFTTVANPPANDDCLGAIALIPGVDFAAGAVIGTNVAATTNPDLVPECQDAVLSEVWYTVVVPADGNITIQTAQDGDSENDDTIIAAYSGDCDTLTEIGCNDDDDDGTFSLLDLSGRTPGETIYIAVWQYDSFFGSTPGTFQISAYNASLGLGEIGIDRMKSYPNPVKDVLNLSYDENITHVSVINLLGQEVMSKNIGNTTAQLDMSSLMQGTYMVKVNTENASKVLKVIKQ